MYYNIVSILVQEEIKNSSSSITDIDISTAETNTNTNSNTNSNTVTTTESLEENKNLLSTSITPVVNSDNYETYIKNPKAKQFLNLLSE